MAHRHMTLAFIVRDGQMLLGLKKRGFATGKWNGFGGKVSPEETAEDAVRRELSEESGLVIEEMHKVGDVIFHNSEDEHHRVEIFSVDTFSGELVETEEMKPKWFPLDQIPYDQMWEDDKHWHPLFLAGKCFEGEFFFKDGHIVKTTLSEHAPY